MQEKIRKYVNEKGASEITGLKLPTLRNYRHLGKGPNYYKIGRAVRYSLADLEQFMEAHKIKTEKM